MTMEAVKEMDVLRELTRTVVGRAKHQAQALEHLALTLAGAVATYHDPGTIRPGTRDGHHLGSCWFEIKGVQYFLSFDHGVGRIRSGGKQGPVAFETSETGTGEEVLAWFESKSPLPAVAG